MPYTSYVLSPEGIVTTVADWTTVVEELVDTYHEGSNYRDEFDISMISEPGTSAVATSLVYPDGTELTTGVGFSYDGNPTSVLPDYMSHTPPRAEPVKQTRLRFKNASAVVIAEFKPAEWASYGPAMPIRL